jgi:CheY-like chemotaxis protein
MDCQMPELDGFEATRRIRRADSGVHDPAVPVIAMTANAMKGDRDACLAAGMDDYVAKPVKADDLAAAMQRALRAERPRPATDPGGEEIADADLPPAAPGGDAADEVVHSL